MPHVGGRYVDEDEYADLVADAREEAYYDSLDNEGWTCEGCGELWNPGYVSATRIDPGYVKQDYCPHCGDAPRCDGHGMPLVGRQSEEDS